MAEPRLAPWTPTYKPGGGRQHQTSTEPRNRTWTAFLILLTLAFGFGAAIADAVRHLI